jgi:hypothetical protein
MKALLSSVYVLVVARGLLLHLLLPMAKSAELLEHTYINEPPRAWAEHYSRLLEESGAPAAAPTPASDFTSKHPSATSWAVLLPMISTIMWAIRKHGTRCCGADILDDTVPDEIVVQLEDIELQNVPLSLMRSATKDLDDPVTGLSMLNTSDWTDDDPIHDYYHIVVN